jgi:hypothetical protein
MLSLVMVFVRTVMFVVASGRWPMVFMVTVYVRS